MVVCQNRNYSQTEAITNWHWEFAVLTLLASVNRMVAWDRACPLYEPQLRMVNPIVVEDLSKSRDIPSPQTITWQKLPLGARGPNVHNNNCLEALDHFYWLPLSLPSLSYIVLLSSLSLSTITQLG